MKMEKVEIEMKGKHLILYTCFDEDDNNNVKMINEHLQNCKAFSGGVSSSNRK